MEGHEKEPDVKAPQLTLPSRIVAVLRRHYLLLRVVGRVVVVSLISLLAVSLAWLTAGPDWPVLTRFSSNFIVQYLLIYYLMGYWVLPRLLSQRRLGWLMFWSILAFWIAYLINRTVIFTVTPTLPQAIRYTNRIRALLEPVGWLGCFVSLRVFLWNFVFSVFSPLVFLMLKLIKDTVVFRQQQFRLTRNRLLLDRDNALLKLNFLKVQVSPHFLFNTLNSIYSQVVSVDDRAADLVLRLADLMRYNLYEANVPLLPLDKEISYLRSYVVLEQTRHGDRLSVRFNTTGNLSAYQIAPLLLITYVENAFKHGIKSGADGAYVAVEATIDADALVFTVENSISHGPTVVMARKAGGVGLPNVQKRLNLLYPGRHRLSQTMTDQFYRVTLHISLLPIQAAVPSPQPVTR